MNTLYATIHRLLNLQDIHLTYVSLSLKIVLLSVLMLETTTVESLRLLNQKPLITVKSSPIPCQLDTASITITKEDYLKKYSKFLAIEGGLSSDPYDRYNSKRKYHTNKGVRYSTFKLILPNSTYKEFITMNDSTYLKIIKYHERVVSVDFKTTSNLRLDKQIKLFLIEELWACGNIDRYKGIYNLDLLYKMKERRYAQLLIKKPHLNRYKKGWKRRREEFKLFVQTI